MPDEERTLLPRFVSRRTFLARAGAGLAAFALFGSRTLGFAAAAAWDPSMELALRFQTNVSGFGRHRNPYVAVWIEDANGNPVRTLALWADLNRHARYVEHLSRWFREVALVPGGQQLAYSASRPTTVAGTYSVVWDGTNDHGQLVPLGTYYVCVEMVREHGPYEIVRDRITLGDAPTSTTLAGQGELGDVSVDYRSNA